MSKNEQKTITDKLLYFTPLLFSLFMIGKFTLPSLFSNWYVSFPIALSLMILFPLTFSLSIFRYCSSKSLGQFKSVVGSLFFYGLFALMLNIGSTVMSSSIVLTNSALDYKDSTGRSMDQIMIEMFVDSSANRREHASRMVFWEYGIILPYKDSLNSFSLYEPTAWDSSYQLKQTQTNNRENDIDTVIHNSLIESSLGNTLHILFFGIITMIVLIYDYRKRLKNNVNRQD